MSTKTDELMRLAANCTANFGSEDDYVKARAALRSAIQEALSGWRPIETAPEDTYVLCSGHEGNDPSQPRWIEKGITNGGIWFDGNGLELYPPTHWQTLPEPPEAP